MSTKALWAKHRRFIMQVFGGLAAFLVLLSIAQGCADIDDDAQLLSRRAAAIELQLRTLDTVYSPAKQERAVLGDREQSLLGALALSAKVAVEIAADEEKYTTHFHEQKEKVYSSFADRANRVGLAHPPQKEVSFDEHADLTPQEWKDRYLQLEVLRRVLDAAIEQRVRKIERIAPGAVEFEKVPGVTDRVLLRYPVTVELRATFQSVLGFFDGFQKDKEFLSVEIASLKPAEEDPAALVDATIVFVGIDLGAPRESKSGRDGRSTRRIGR
ncbi:MAG: hypothetical protein L0Z55_04605 [Planctomycetes bacterium]|nr:hypothetical protein [Planctomycetota bacterium]